MTTLSTHNTSFNSSLFITGRGDIRLVTSFIRIFPSDQNPRQLVRFDLLIDSTAQELDETFTITFAITTSDFESISPPLEIRNTLQGTIVDNNGMYLLAF